MTLNVADRVLSTPLSLAVIATEPSATAVASPVARSIVATEGFKVDQAISNGISATMLPLIFQVTATKLATSPRAKSVTESGTTSIRVIGRESTQGRVGEHASRHEPNTPTITRAPVAIATRQANGPTFTPPMALTTQCDLLARQSVLPSEATGSRRGRLLVARRT